MFRNLIIVSMLFLGTHAAHADDGPFVEVGVGYAFDTPWTNVMSDTPAAWKGSNPIALLAVGYQHKDWEFSYQHISNWLSGFPLNNDEETGLDMVTITYRFQ